MSADSYSSGEPLSNRHVSDFVFHPFLSLFFVASVKTCTAIRPSAEARTEEEDGEKEEDASAFLILSVTTINTLIIGDSSGTSGSFR